MKKLISGLFFATLIMPVFAAPVYRMPVKQADSGWFNGTWYIGGRAGLSLMNWTNDYSTSAPTAAGEEGVTNDSMSEVVFGGAAFAGHIFDAHWRGEVEAGLIGKYEDEVDGVSFELAVPYVIANAYYDFNEGFYLGGGLGIALPKTRLSAPVYFIGNNSSERVVSPMIGLMGGWTHRLDERLVLDLRYRLAMLWGPEHTRDFISGVDTAVYGYTVDTGLILDNSISLGLRYEF